MKFFSGFCLKNERELFKEFLEEGEFNVAGFSYGAQKAVDFVLNSNRRVNKLQLISPAFFDYNEKLIQLNLRGFKKEKNYYVKKFLEKSGIETIENFSNFISLEEGCNDLDLEKMFRFDWEKIKKIDCKIEVFIGEKDKIISVEKAIKFFQDFAEIYLIKKGNHFLRSSIG